MSVLDFLGGGLLGGATKNPLAGALPLASILKSFQQPPGPSQQQMQNPSPDATAAINAGPQGGPPATSANVPQAGGVAPPPVTGQQSLSDALSGVGSGLSGASLAGKTGAAGGAGADFMSKAMPWLMALQALKKAHDASQPRAGGGGPFEVGGGGLL